ncbi:galactose ABC transporter substrate-binding protein [bacterium 1xD8-48]|nr:galactose ABC transporter substrate-binding protein [Lachnospiraceae bacterium]NBJ97634.1 galactose ABC transporter substrate-binding protein [bacterium 1xD8-48]
MKKYCILLSELWLCAFFLLTGCAGTKGAEEKKSIRIGVSLYRGDDTFLNNIRGELERCAKDFEQEKGVKVTLDIQDARGNQNTQNDQVERFLALGCDVLCINPVDRTAASVLIDKAMAAQTPVIFFNRQPVEEDMDRWDRIFYVGAEAKSSAVLQGSIVVDGYRKNPEKLDLNGDGVVSYVLLEGESSHQDSLIRTEWSVQTLKDGGVPIEKLTGGIANWERSQASALMEQWLEKYPGRIELVICNNDDMALGAIDAMERAGMEGIAVVGIDGTTPGLAAVESGKLMGTVAIDRTQYAGAILAIATGEALGWEPDAKLEFEDGKYYQCPWQIVVKK